MNPDRWAVCQRCGHYRVEHDERGRRCEYVHPDIENPHPLDRCDCLGWKPLTPPGGSA